METESRWEFVLKILDNYKAAFYLNFEILYQNWQKLLHRNYTNQTFGSSLRSKLQPVGEKQTNKAAYRVNPGKA